MRPLPTSRRTYVLRALMFLAAVGIGAALFLRLGPARPAAQDLSPNQLAEQHWAERIRSVGGLAAYKEFAVSVKNDTVPHRHELAHAFGNALYSVLGDQGLAVCDAQFSYGCYHAFLGKAIAQQGLSVVVKLDDACRQAMGGNYLSCQHGIGHGVIAALGYTRQDLDRALAVCKGLAYSDPIGGCYGGVFMEYNFRTLLGPAASNRAPVNNNDFDPCDTLAEPYWRACAFWQPQWWAQGVYALEKMPKKAVRLGALCDAMEHDLLLRRTCYEGLGTIMPMENRYDIASTVASCEAASKNTQYQLYCKSYAANVYGQDMADPKKAEEICQGLVGDAAEYCRDYAQNKANIANQISLPTPTP